MARFSALALAAALSMAVLPPTAMASEEVAPAPLTTYIDEGFDTSRWDTQSSVGWWNWPDTIVRGPIEGLLGNGTRVTMRAGTNIGAMLDWEFARHGYAEPEEAWFRYWMRFDDEPQSTGKLPGFMGLYSGSGRGQVPPSPSQPGWSARVLFGPGSDDETFRLGYYTYHLDQAGVNGDAMWWSSEAPLDEWVCVEGRVAMNTPGVADGTLQAWLDDAEVFHRNDIAFRASGQEEVRVKQFMFEVYYGGQAARYDTGVAFDELRVADHRIGCSSGMPSFEDTGQSDFVEDIEWLVANGITVGCNPPENTLFCPRTAVTRSHLAAFLHRGLGDVITVPELPGPPDPPTMWGIDSVDYAGSMRTMTAATGAPVDLVRVDTRLNLEDWTVPPDPDNVYHRPPSTTLPAQLSEIHDVGSVPYVEVSHRDVAGFKAGDHDANFEAWLDTVAGWLEEDPSHRLLIVPFPDANSSGVKHLTSPRVFREAYYKVHDAVRDRGIGPDQVRFVFQLSADSAEGEGSEAAAYAPELAAVDLAAVSWRNDGTMTEWDDWGGFLAGRVDEMTEALGPQVPILLASVATRPYEVAGDRDRWFGNRDLWLRGLTAGMHSTSNVVGVLYADRDRDGIAYGVDSATDPEPAFVEFAAGIGSPGNRLDWVFNGSIDSWKEETIASLPSSVFVDDDDSPFEVEAVWLARSGITNGCNPPDNDHFCPDDKVTRGQVAAFLHRALGDLVPSGEADAFRDVGEGSTYAADVAWLAGAGIALPCNPPWNDRYCPNADISRGEMAAVLRLALGSLEP